MPPESILSLFITFVLENLPLQELRHSSNFHSLGQLPEVGMLFAFGREAASGIA